MTRLPWYQLAFKLLTYALGLLVIYWVLLKLTNHSPSSDQIVIAVGGFLASFLVTIFFLLIKIVGDLRELKGAFVHHVKQNDAEFTRINAEIVRIHDRRQR